MKNKYKIKNILLGGSRPEIPIILIFIITFLIYNLGANNNILFLSINFFLSILILISLKKYSYLTVFLFFILAIMPTAPQNLKIVFGLDEPFTKFEPLRVGVPKLFRIELIASAEEFKKCGKGTSAVLVQGRGMKNATFEVKGARITSNLMILDGDAFNVTELELEELTETIEVRVSAVQRGPEIYIGPEISRQNQRRYPHAVWFRYEGANCRVLYHAQEILRFGEE